MVAYLDHLEAREELDLEAATEFLVLIAALLELKSRLMLPGEEVEELDELAPAEAAEELLERLLALRALPRRRRLAGRRAREDEQARALPRGAAARRRCGARRSRAPRRRTTRRCSGAALGGLLRTPPPLDLRHLAAPRVSLAERARRPARPAAPRPASRSTTRSRGADRMTVAVTLFALLELYKRGEAAWEQDEPFGPITVPRRTAPPRGGGVAA